MRLILKLEELVMLLLGIFAFSLLDFSWWWFLLLFFTPDLGMLAYFFGNKSGAILYNIFHHKGLAIFLWILGFNFENQIGQLLGVILFAHASFDRLFGYGLKYETGFKFTHLGEIGK
ncbi:DUF4260 domain-containing protein [Salegentibacter sp. F14]